MVDVCVVEVGGILVVEVCVVEVVGKLVVEVCDVDVVGISVVVEISSVSDVVVTVVVKSSSIVVVASIVVVVMISFKKDVVGMLVSFSVVNKVGVTSNVELVLI